MQIPAARRKTTLMIDRRMRSFVAQMLGLELFDRRELPPLAGRRRPDPGPERQPAELAGACRSSFQRDACRYVPKEDYEAYAASHGITYEQARQEMPIQRPKLLDEQLK